MAETKTVFVSKFSQLKKVLTPARYRYNNHDERVYVPGISVQFEGGRFETSDQDIIDRLMKDKMYSISFWRVDGNKADTAMSESTKEELESEHEANDTVTNSCPHCPFKAENKTGLMAHIRAKHPDKQ